MYINSGGIIAHVTFTGEPEPATIEAIREMIRLAHKHGDILSAKRPAGDLSPTVSSKDVRLSHSKTGGEKTP